MPVQRRTVTKPSRRAFSYIYFFEVTGQRFQVCKEFYLATLAISQKPIYYVHQNKDSITGLPKVSGKGHNQNSKRRLNDHQRNLIVEHISSFPHVASHYCRMRSNKNYLDGNLNVAKMYDLYKEKCLTLAEQPVKMSFYRYVFNYNFNLEFHKPKSDICAKCALFEINKDKDTPDDGSNLEHIHLKETMRSLIDQDNASGTPIITFDLQNVITCPKTDIGEAFYLSKLVIYNLTAHLSTTKKVYCAIWHEYSSGRSANDIASALYKILNKIFEEHCFEKIITFKK